jgi:hypothetical protein
MSDAMSSAVSSVMGFLEEDSTDSSVQQDAAIADISADLELLRDDPRILKALRTGQDLTRYSRKVRALDFSLSLPISEQVDEELRQVERDSIKDYISEAENLSTLHGNLKRCDEYLLKLEQVPAQPLALFGSHAAVYSFTETRALSEKFR